MSLDPQIPWLENALNPTTATVQLQSAIPSLKQVTAATLVRHKVGRRALVQYDAETTTGPLALLGKIRAKGTDRTSYQIQQALWHNGWSAHSPDGFSTPEPLGRVPDWHMILQRRVPGVPLTQRLAHPEGLALMPPVAALAHKLHRTPLPTPKTHTLADELKILHDRLPLVIEHHPHWAARIDRVLEGCDRLASQFSHHPDPGQTRGSAPTPPKSKIQNPKFTPLSLIHRDFYPDQILVDADRLWLVDLDLCCQGSPAVDIGNFIAHITEQSLRELGDAAALRDRELTLQTAYLSHNSAPGSGATMAITAREIDLYTVLTLVRHIHISTRISSRRPYTEALLSLGETRLATMLEQ
ncbi:phosphotransferase family protein [Nodosilinea sp. PGN35]|uniref:phosphotransferase family protein n=1 Tax=Nodosilinea sp. PGN35 TaxID=3020489 RepID=UPI0023B2E2D0|nr:phosphotransferase [Nodosilinea sp. TSF1-S3]MDF0368619.1 phosphotransferase [Nodosilinea sp. TSF1-S3]